MRQLTPSAAWRYGVAILACAVAALVKLLLGPLIVPSAFLTAYAAVLVTAWYGGFGAGLLAIGLSSVISLALFLPSVLPPWSADPITLLRVGLFVLIATAISRFTAAIRRTYSELGVRVEERTAELSRANAILQAQIAESERTEAELRESEANFRTLAETVATATFIYREMQVRYANSAAQAITGYTRAELLTMSLFDVIHPEFHDLVLRRGIARQRGEDAPNRYEVKIVTKHGEERWVDYTRAVIEFDGAPAVLGTAFDITDRKRFEEALHAAHDELEARVEQRTAELTAANLGLREETRQHQQTAQALRESEQRFRAMYDQAAVGVSLMGRDGRWVLVNQKLCEILGYTQDELLQRSFQDITYPADLDDSLAHLRRALANEVQTYSLEKRHVRKDGSLVWVNVTGSVVRDPSGEPQYGLAVVEDITERKRAEAELKELSERFRSMLESMTDAFYVVDHRGQVTYVNPSAAQLVQRSREDLIGKHIWDAFPEAVGSVFYQQFQKVMSERIAVDVEAYYAPLNRWFKVRSYPSQDGLSALIEDITERHGQEVTVVSDILRALNAHLNVADAFPAAAAGLRALTGCDRSSLTLFDEQYQWLTVLALDQDRSDVGPGSHLLLADIPAAAAVLVGRPHLVPDLAVELHSPVVQRLYKDGMRSALSLPLRGAETVSGMLTLTWRTLGGATQAELPVVTQIADAIALAVEKSQLFEQVRAGRERLESLSRRLLEVQEAERRHLARELHDEIGQGLTGLKFALDAVERLPIEAARTQLSELHKLVNDLLTRVRDLSLDLRPGMLDDLGLLPALLWLFGRYSSQTSVRVTVEHSGLDRRFPPEVETAAYRIVQEALTNVARHAGVAQVTVRAWADSTTVNVQVADQGAGFDPERASANGPTGGLTGMRERSVLLGGHITIESAPGAGTRLSAELPINGHMEEHVDVHHDRAG